MMRNSLPKLGRRAAVSSIVAVALSASGALSPAMSPAHAATPVQTTFSQTLSQLSSLWSLQTGERAGDNREQRLPSPPRPSWLCPNERVVLGGTRTTRTAGTPTTPTPTTTGGTTTGGTTTGGTTTGGTTTGGTTTGGTTTTAPAVTATAVIPPGAKSGAGAPGAGTGKTLVVYDNTGPYSWLGEVYGIQAVNLISHFGAWTAHPVGKYTAGELAGFTSVVYVGSTYDEPVPVAFLDDVTATKIPVTWMYDNIWQLTARDPNFTATRGFTWKGFDTSSVTEVGYKGTALTRDTLNAGGIMDHVISDPTKASVVATAKRADGTTFPWAVRSGNFTYVGEIPFSYVSHDDRYLAFADMLFDSLNPTAATRHRALVRIEDVGPDADPAELRAVTNYLYSKQIPFSVAVYPRYRDPKGVDNGGRAADYILSQRPLVVAELKYMTSHGGTLLMHGYTHQYGTVANPYDAVSANDFEFYRAHIDAANSVIYDGPVAEDSTAWMNGRIMSSAMTFMVAGLATPTIFEPPHYAASAVDYKAINTTFGKRYDRGLYFPGLLSGAAVDYTKLSGQFFPYTVRDVYGSAVVPENIGNIEPVAFNNHPPRLPADLVASAKRNLVIRDGSASLFYHPYLGTAYLKTTVEGIQGLGYTFVTANSMLAN